MSDDLDRPSRRRRILARGKIALALTSPLVSLVALYLLAHSSGAADSDRFAALSIPTPAATAIPDRPLEPKFTNPLTVLLPEAPVLCPSPLPTTAFVPTPTPGSCADHLEVTFTNHWLS